MKIPGSVVSWKTSLVCFPARVKSSMSSILKWADPLVPLRFITPTGRYKIFHLQSRAPVGVRAKPSHRRISQTQSALLNVGLEDQTQSHWVLWASAIHGVSRIALKNNIKAVKMIRSMSFLNHWETKRIFIMISPLRAFVICCFRVSDSSEKR